MSRVLGSQNIVGIPGLSRKLEITRSYIKTVIKRKPYILFLNTAKLVKRKSSMASDRETSNPKEITSDFELLSKTMQGDRNKIAQVYSM